ncbi:hypothetical protein [Pseudomonas syringae]|uniref:hypothetical protein n=1 Tax=Pseudomonas syringae TaxID=317 RepID=UPI0004633C73|nr:hypothetical protein [Pseudomonas syringae]UOF20053.1 hypothetical protein N023_00510 [Pseudomonas syringae CC440]UZA77601.1 hypothetical protein EZZ79_00555 [Pseudomonas syringae]
MIFYLPDEVNGFVPAVARTLLNVEPHESQHNALGLNHPADVFIFSFMDVVRSLDRLAKAVENGASKIEESNGAFLNDLNIDIFNLLFHSNNYIESCQSIVRSLFPATGETKFKTVSREFLATIKSYHTHVATIMNDIKHKHRRIRAFTFAGTETAIIGYYIEGIVAEGVIGPDPSIHKPFNGMATGFSLNTEIPYHVFNIYKTAECLDSILRRYIKAKPDKSYVLGRMDDIAKCLEQISLMPTLLLPNEFGKEYATVVRKKSDSYTISLPGTRKPQNKKPEICNVKIATGIGLKARTFAPPYFLGR